MCLVSDVQGSWREGRKGEGKGKGREGKGKGREVRGGGIQMVFHMQIK